MGREDEETWSQVNPSSLNVHSKTAVLIIKISRLQFHDQKRDRVKTVFWSCQNDLFCVITGELFHEHTPDHTEINKWF